MWGGSGYLGGIYAPEAPINAVANVLVTEQIYPYTGLEPITLEETKEYCKIDFNDEDNLIQDFITSARLSLQKYTGLYFTQERLIVQVVNGCGGIELPGPVPGGPAAIDLTLVTDWYGNAINPGNIVLSGISYNNLEAFVNVQAPLCQLQFIYSAGYADLPVDLKIAMKATVFFLYENRGEDAGISSGVRTYGVSYIPKAALELCKKYIRVSNLSM